MCVGKRTACRRQRSEWPKTPDQRVCAHVYEYVLVYMHSTCHNLLCRAHAPVLLLLLVVVLLMKMMMVVVVVVLSLLMLMAYFVAWWFDTFE